MTMDDRIRAYWKRVSDEAWARTRAWLDTPLPHEQPKVAPLGWAESLLGFGP